MGHIRVALDDVKEGSAVEEGTYTLRVLKVDDTPSKKGNEMTTLMLRIEDAPIPNANPVYHYLVYPNEQTEGNAKQMMLLNVKRFLALMGIDYKDGFDPDEWQGETFECFLDQEESDDGVVRNKLRLPRLKE